MKPSMAVLICKRALDLSAGLFGTLAFLLSYPLIALLIKLESKGPVLYSQERVGMNRRQRRGGSGAPGAPADRRVVDYGGRSFVIYKYRTMRIDAEAAGPQLCAKGLDPRVTRVGKWLRALHIDELPQFLNIVRGDMSFIGPRPERPHFTMQYAKTLPHYADRTLFIRPGLTGLAQIVLGYDDSMDSVVRKSHYDLSYRASFCSFSAWIRMEVWVILNTILYLGQKPQFEGETRNLVGLKRAKLLPFLGRSPLKESIIRAEGSSAAVAGGIRQAIAEASGVASALPTASRPSFSGAGDWAPATPAEATTTLAQETTTLEPPPSPRSSPAEPRRKDHPLFIAGKSVHELERQVQALDLGRRKLEVCLLTSSEFDLEDLGGLVRLVHRVTDLDGRMVIKEGNAKVQKILKAIHLDKVVELQRAPASLKNFLTVDVECWFHAYNMQARTPRSSWHLQHSNIEDNMRRLLDLFALYDTKATFFVLGWVADHYPEVVRMIEAGGHEIGTHGYSHNLLTDMTPDDFEYDLLKSVEAISRHTSQPITGHRASNFTVMKSTLWALDILAKHGFTYDSSVFPVGRERYGIPDYPNRLPHTLHLESGLSLKEVPMSTWKRGKALLPVGGGGYLRLYPISMTERYIEQMNMKGLPAMVYLHPWEVDITQKRQKLGLWKGFQHYVNTDSTEWKLHRLLQKFSFGGVRETLEMPRLKSLTRRNPVHVVGTTEGLPQRRYAKILSLEPMLEKKRSLLGKEKVEQAAAAALDAKGRATGSGVLPSPLDLAGGMRAPETEVRAATGTYGPLSASLEAAPEPAQNVIPITK